MINREDSDRANEIIAELAEILKHNKWPGTLMIITNPDGKYAFQTIQHHLGDDMLKHYGNLGHEIYRATLAISILNEQNITYKNKLEVENLINTINIE